jgi:hypothetical protein
VFSPEGHVDFLRTTRIHSLNAQIHSGCENLLNTQFVVTGRQNKDMYTFKQIMKKRSRKLPFSSIPAPGERTCIPKLTTSVFCRRKKLLGMTADETISMVQSQKTCLAQ